VRNISTAGSPRRIPSRKTIAQIAIAASESCRPKRASRRCSGVLAPSVVASSVAIRPSSVPMPVATTTPSPRPRVTIVPDQAMLTRSPSGMSASSSVRVTFSTGCDSPVSAASSTCSPNASASRRSAGTTPPASSNTKSPGTSSVATTVAIRPSRRTVAFSAASCCSARSACSARYSWMNPMIAFRITIARIAAASSGSPITPEIRAAAMSSRIMKSAN